MGCEFYLEDVICRLCLSSQFGEEYACVEFGVFEVVYELIKRNYI